MAIVIAPAQTLEDVHSAVSLYFVVSAHEHSRRGHTPEPVSDERFLDEYQHWLGIYESSPAGFMIAKDDQAADPRRVIGVAAAIQRPPQWMLTNFYVDPAYHRQGIGQQLFDRAFAVREGCTRFTLHASLHPAAQTIYLTAGLYPQPYSVMLEGRGDSVVAPEGLIPDKVAVNPSESATVQAINQLDRTALGFERAVDHFRWAKSGAYYLVHSLIPPADPIAYFRVDSHGNIAPLVANAPDMIPAVIDLAIVIARSTSATHKLFVPGANVSAIKHLLDHGFKFREVELLLSSDPTPGLDRAVFHDTDFL